MQPPEDVIRCVFMPALTGQALPNDFEHDLFVLPSQWGGLGLCNPIFVPANLVHPLRLMSLSVI